MAIAMPVRMPDVASTTVIPGLSSPRFSASSMMATARRSSTDVEAEKYEDRRRPRRHYGASDVWNQPVS